MPHPMPKFMDLFQEQPMAILPAKMDEIQAFIERRFHGQASDWQAAAPAESAAKERIPYTVHDGVATIPVRGVLAKRANLVTDFSGGTSMELLRADLRAADADPAVRAIVLHAESPGGTVDGCVETADTLWAVRGRKPVVTYVDGMCASAALWICSGAHKIIAGPTAQCGSLGVLTTHYDVSAQDKARGIVRTVISSGEYKSISSDEKPLSEPARAYLEAQVYQLFAMFVEAVARNRGMEIDAVLKKMGDGRVFIGADAVAAGAADAVGTLDDAFKAAKDMIKPGNKFFFTPKKEDRSMKPEELKAQFPETHTAIAEEARNAAMATATENHAAVIAEQKKSICALAGAVFGAEAGAKLQTMVDSGLTVAQLEAIGYTGQAAAAAGTTRKNILDGLQASAPGALKPAAEQPAAGTDQKPGFMALVDAHMLAAKCSKGDAIRECMAKHPAEHKAWLAEMNKK